MLIVAQYKVHRQDGKGAADIYRRQASQIEMQQVLISVNETIRSGRQTADSPRHPYGISFHCIAKCLVCFFFRRDKPPNGSHQSVGGASISNPSSAT